MERTGISQLDALARRFEAEESVYLSGADIDKPVAEWRSCSADNAACHAIAEVFVEFLAEEGIEAELSDEADQEWFADSPDALGYNDRPVQGVTWHTVAIVYCDDQVFSYDWTAAQYGYKEFPLIQRYQSGEGWQR